MSEAATSKFARRRDALIDAAAQLFQARGVDGATLNDVAAAVGLNTKSVRYYFKLKDDLIAECLLRAMAHNGRILETAARAPSPRDRLSAYGLGFFEWMRQIEAGEQPHVPDFGLMRALDSPSVHRTYHRMRDEIGELVAPGEHGSTGRRAVEHYLQSQFLGTMTWSKLYSPRRLGRAAAHFVDILSQGIAAGPGGWTLPAQLPKGFLEEDAEGPQEAFLRVATRLINNQGYRGASVDKIAAELNVTKGAFYHHMETKNDLIGRCLERTCEVMERAQDVADDAGGSGLQRLVNTAAFLIRYQLEVDGRLLRMAALSAVSSDIARDLTLKMDRVTANFASMVSDGIIDGSLRRIDANIAAQMITGVVNAGEELWYWFPKTAPEAVVSLALDPLVNGVFGAEEPDRTRTRVSRRRR
jgi:AcrR family transcriptional regulator